MSNHQFNLPQPELELSIIIPIYNVEKYVKDCLLSIFSQDLDEECFEVIIINDGTKDRSMEVIANIIHNHSNIKIINQKNQGLSVARNNGIAIANGEYILFVDSDDQLVYNSLKPLIESAITSKADLVMAEYIKINDKDYTSTAFPTLPRKIEIKEKSAKQLYLEDLVPWARYVFRTLYRREFLNKNSIRFVPGITYEDQPFTHECYLKAKKCLKAQWPFYVYRASRPSAITSSFDTRKAKDMCISIAKSWELTHLHGIDPTVLHKLKDNIFNHFKVMTLLLAHDISSASNRQHIIDFVREEIPEMKFNNGYKQIIVSFLFKNFPHFFIHLRYIYGKYWEDSLLPFYYHKTKMILFKHHNQ